MQPTGDENDEFVADCLECLKIKFVNKEEQINNDDPRYPVEFAYVQFGDLEKVYGYKDLDMTLCYTEATMFPHLLIKYSAIVQDGKVPPDDIYDKMEIELVSDQKKSLRSIDAFIGKIKEQIQFEPFGTQIAHFIDEKKAGKKFALYRIEGELSEEQKLYLERIQSILFFYIEKAQYTDSDDNRFVYYVLYEVFEDSNKTGFQYRIVGYSSLYKYFHYPNTWRLRNSHMFIFPQFRKMGLGASFMHAIHSDFAKNSEVFDSTAEAPVPGYIAARDYAAVLELTEMPEFSKEKLTEDFNDEKAEAARIKWKMNKKQVLRAYEILQLAIAEKDGIEGVNKFKESLLKRISKPYNRKTKEFKRMEAALSPEEMDLITANNGDNLTEEEKKKFRDDLMELYQNTIVKLEKCSDKFAAFMSA